MTIDSLFKGCKRDATSHYLKVPQKESAKPQPSAFADLEVLQGYGLLFSS